MARTTLTHEEVRRQLDAAEARARAARPAGPRAVAVRYDDGARQVVVSFANGCSAGIAVDLVPGLEGATPSELAAVQIHADGEAIAWEVVDAGVDVRGLLLRAFDVRAWAAAYMGSATSPAKAEAARRNGRRGGRPRKDAAAGE